MLYLRAISQKPALCYKFKNTLNKFTKRNIAGRLPEKSRKSFVESAVSKNKKKQDRQKKIVFFMKGGDVIF